MCFTSHNSVPSTVKDSYSCSNKFFELLVWYFHNSLIYCFSVEDDSAQVPFPELCGESVEYLERTSDAILALSNFRLFIRFNDSFVNVSLTFSQNYLNGTFHQTMFKLMIFFFKICNINAHIFLSYPFFLARFLCV